MFDLNRTLLKYLRTFLQKNAVLMIGLTDQSDYSICHFMVIIFIHTVGCHLLYKLIVLLFDKKYLSKSSGKLSLYGYRSLQVSYSCFLLDYLYPSLA